MNVSAYTRWISLDGFKHLLRKQEIIYQDKLFDLIEAGLVEKVRE